MAVSQDALDVGQMLEALLQGLVVCMLVLLSW